MLNIDSLAKIKISFGPHKVIIGNPLFWIGAVIILLFFLFKWGIKKFIGFAIITSALLFLMFKVDSFIISFFGKEEGNFYTVLTKPLFLFLIAFVFVYYNFIQKD